MVTASDAALGVAGSVGVRLRVVSETAGRAARSLGLGVRAAALDRVGVPAANLRR